MAEGKRERKIYSPEQKVIIIRELLENNVPISPLADKYQVHPNDIYNLPAAGRLEEKALRGSKGSVQEYSGQPEAKDSRTKKDRKAGIKVKRPG